MEQMQRRLTALKPHELLLTEAELEMGRQIELLEEQPLASLSMYTNILRTATTVEAVPGADAFAECFDGWENSVKATLDARMGTVAVSPWPFQLRDMIEQSERAMAAGVLASQFLERVRVSATPLMQHASRMERYFLARTEAVERALAKWTLFEDERMRLVHDLLDATEKAADAKARVIPSGKGSVLSKQAHIEAERTLHEKTQSFRREIAALTQVAASVTTALQHAMSAAQWYQRAERVAREVRAYKAGALVIDDTQLAKIKAREPREYAKYIAKCEVIGPLGQQWSNGTSAEFLLHRILEERPLDSKEGSLTQRVSATFDDYQGGTDLIFFSDEVDTENKATQRAPVAVVDVTMNVDKYEQHYPGRVWSLDPTRPPFMVRRTILQLNEALVAQFIHEFLLGPNTSARDLYEAAVAAPKLPVQSTVPTALVESHPIPVLDYETFRAHLRYMLEHAPEPSEETATRQRARLTQRTIHRTQIRRHVVGNRPLRGAVHHGCEHGTA